MEIIHHLNHVRPSQPGDWSESLGARDGAWISKCEKYRTMLWRTFDEAPTVAPVVFAMLNPSTADHMKLDPTLTRCAGFARREGAGGFIVVNVHPYRATDPDAMAKAVAWMRPREATVVEAENLDAVVKAVNLSSAVVVAWGANVRGRASLEAMAWQIVSHTRLREKPLLCFGLTKGNQPKHPLYLAADTLLVPALIDMGRP